MLLGRFMVRSGAFFEVLDNQTYFMRIREGIVCKGAESKEESVLLKMASLGRVMNVGHHFPLSASGLLTF